MMFMWKSGLQAAVKTEIGKEITTPPMLDKPHAR